MRVIKVRGVNLDSSNMASSLEKHSFDNFVFIIDKPKKHYNFIEELSTDESCLYILNAENGIEPGSINVKIIDKGKESSALEYIPSLSELIKERAIRKKFGG